MKISHCTRRIKTSLYHRTGYDAVRWGDRDRVLMRISCAQGIGGWMSYPHHLAFVSCCKCTCKSLGIVRKRAAVTALTK